MYLSLRYPSPTISYPQQLLYETPYSPPVSTNSMHVHGFNLWIYLVIVASPWRTILEDLRSWSW